MKKKFYSLALLFGMLFTFGFTEQAYASHDMGSEITYLNVAPNTYSITYKFYRDCSGIMPGTSATISLKSPGCNNGRVVTISRIGSPVLNNPYCSQITPICNSANILNIEEYIYSGIITFSQADVQCTNWLISTSECSRATAANLTYASSYCQYSEAYINLAAGINNSSAQFLPLPSPFYNKYEPVTCSYGAIDPDGDSLVYSLKPALDSYNNPIGYEPFNSSNQVIFNSDSTKIALLPSGINYSPTMPIISYTVDWNKPAPYIAVPSFNLDPKTGSLSFTPIYYDSNINQYGKNRYTVVVQVDEYRKLNGLMVKVGYVRRDILITIVNNGPNGNPAVTNPVANGITLTPGTIINLHPGSTMHFNVNSTDRNTSDSLIMSADLAQTLPGATFSVSSVNHPTGTLTWTPTAAQVRSQPYYFHVTVKDNACPIRGYQTQTYGVRVSNSGAVTGVKIETKSNLNFTAYPNPFSQEVSFKFTLQSKAQYLVIYNVLGKETDRILLTNLAAGEQTIRWENAARFAAGAYVAKLFSADNSVQTLKFSKLQ